MYNIRMPLVYTILAMLIFAMAGCSGGGDPISPQTSAHGMGPGSLSNTRAQNSPAENHRVLWGLYDVMLNTETGESEILPLRGVQMTVNVNTFLQPPGGSAANLGITIIDASTFKTAGNIDIDVNITHPFIGSNKFHGFDVMGVFMTNGAVGGVRDTGISYPRTDFDAYLKNADGYTRWMNPLEFMNPGLLGYTPGVKGFPPTYTPTNTINGFKYFADGLGVEDDIGTFFQTQANVDKRGIFLAGSTNSRRYELKFPAPGAQVQVNYQYAILASWDKPDPGSLPDPDPSDFPSNANLQEPFYVDVTDNGSTLYYVNDANRGGYLSLNVEVYDWQGAANPSGVAGEISGIFIEEPNGTVIPGGWADGLPSATVTAGKANSSVFTFDIVGCSPYDTGDLEFLVTVESASPSTYDQGFGSDYPETAVLATYRMYTAFVATSNPCPTPAVTGPTGAIMNINTVNPGFAVSGTNFQSGPLLSIELQRGTGDLVGTNAQVLSPTSAQVDFDTSTVTAGMYDLYFVNGCGIAAPVTPATQVEINTPPGSSGITGPSNGDGNTGIVQYYANAYDTDTDPVDTLTYSWQVRHQPSGQVVIGPQGGDPLNVDFAPLSVAMYDIECIVSDGFAPADIQVNSSFSRDNTSPTAGTPTGPTAAWYNWDIFTYNVVASDMDPGQTLTYMWSLVPQSTVPSFTIPGDPTPGDVTINFASLLPGPGWYDLQCEVDDGQGLPNSKAQSGILQIYVANDPYIDAIPSSKFNQNIVVGTPSTQGLGSCPSYFDTFYGPLGGAPFTHPDITMISGPSLGTPGEMVIADEIGVIVGGLPLGTMGFAHFSTPYTAGNPPAWSWLTTGLFPIGPDMIPGTVHFDATVAGEMLVTNNQMTNKLAGFGVPDPSAFSYYQAGVGHLNDLFTTLPGALQYDVAVDSCNGFDMGSPGAPMSPPMYGLYTQDMAGIITSCGGPVTGPPAANPVHIMMFPAGGGQPVGTPVNAPGSVAVVAPIGGGMVGPGPGTFNMLLGATLPGGPMIFPEPYYALAIDDDGLDNNFPTMLPLPIGKWVVAATIDSDRDVEIYEMDFGVAPPGPAPVNLVATLPMGSFMGGLATAYPLDVEFVSNFTGFGGTSKPVWPTDLLAVLITETASGTWHVELYDLTPSGPTFVSASMPVPVPPGIFPVPGAAYRMDVDESTGEIYVLHEDTLGSASMTVTILTY